MNECRKTKAKVITTTNQKKGQYTEEPMTTHGKNNETTRRRENTRGQVVIGFSFASDWLRKR